MIRSSTVGEVWLSFHSFAKSILEDNVLESGVNISSGVIKRSAQLAWGLKNIDSFDFQHVTIGMC